MKKIVIFASGNGSNAEAICLYAKKQNFAVEAIITDSDSAGVIKKAKTLNVPVHIVLKTKTDSRETHEKKVLETLAPLNFHLIVLAGYERLLSPFFLNSFPKQSILNIHPSLLPLYPGLDSYARAFSDSVPGSGITIHYVDEGMDTGKILFQKAFSKTSGETLDEFKNKGLALEHYYYPQTIEKLLTQNYNYRVEVYPRSAKLLKNTESLVSKIFWLKSDGPLAKLQMITNEVLIDPVVEKSFLSQTEFLNEHLTQLSFNNTIATEVSFLPGVTDNTGFSTRDALLKHPLLKNIALSVATGSLTFTKNENQQVFANTWLEKKTIYPQNGLLKERFEAATLPEVLLKEVPVQKFNLHLSDEDLMKLSQNQLWALSLPELQFVRSHFLGLKREPTDVEMEIISQTWSEHCKHKIFAATIEHTDQEGTRTIKSLFKTFIKGATSRILEEGKINWARSVFTDNAGIVRWDDKLDVCIKVETHNSPSALDPYGGALTGILGVNRDILGCGVGAKPIANTDVFCLPPIDADSDGNWPTELHSPERLRTGVHKGVQDGGNKSGIPTVNGAFHYDLSYAGKPLVYCGTVGVLPHKVGKVESHEKNQTVGDLVVTIGGRIGKDGIHGATFSSQELQENTPSTVVQIGDPLTQKRVTDFILKARDLSLYTSITDSGAGGLSSSVGEMSLGTNGAVIDLALAPVKYEGLTPAELMISESQERMTCSVNPEKWMEFKRLADLYEVEVASLGTFTNDGFLTINYNNTEVAKLSLSFLHEELPAMQLKSSFMPNYERPVWKETKPLKKLTTIKEQTLALLSHPNIRSHEKFVRQYDHEVKAASVLKPLTPEGGPTDAGVIAMKPHGGGDKNGIVIASGLAPQVSRQDTKLMAMYAVDESVRNAIVTGADPSKMVLIDNFCWPDPLPGPNNPDYAQKLGELVRCNEGLYDMAVTFGMPFVSGKDSMKNDAIVQFNKTKTKISVLPTLLVTCMGHIDDVNKVTHSSYRPGDDLWLIGGDEVIFAHTLSTVTDIPKIPFPITTAATLKERYTNFHAAQKRGLILGAHDVSEGGVIVALTEMAINSQNGFKITNLREEKFFGEGMGMIVFAAAPEKRQEIQTLFVSGKVIGSAIAGDEIRIQTEVLKLGQCKKAYVEGIYE